MEVVTPLEFARPREDPADGDMQALVAAIDLVAHGGATRVRLCGLIRPEASAAMGVVDAQDAGVRLTLQRHSSGDATIVVGPVL